MADTERPGAIVIDCGEAMVKAGFAGTDIPLAVFPNAVGRAKNYKSGKMEFFVGDEARAKRAIYTIHRPMENGLVHNWDDLEKILHHTFFNELRAPPEEHPVLWAEDPSTPREHRERLCQIMFETFQVPSYRPMTQGCLAVVASGTMSGLSIDFGDDCVNIVPVYELSMLDWAKSRFPIGGRHVVDQATNLLGQRGYDKVSSKREIAGDIIHKMGYVAQNYEEELKGYKTGTFDHKKYEMPDGEILSVQEERIRCPEIFFQPALIGSESKGLHDVIITTLRDVIPFGGKDLRASNESLLGQLPHEMLAHVQHFVVNNNITKGMHRVVLSGRPSRFPGLSDRFAAEVIPMFPKSPVKVITPEPGFRYALWIGGAIFGSLDVGLASFISKEDYEEVGRGIVHWQTW